MTRRLLVSLLLLTACLASRAEATSLDGRIDLLIHSTDLGPATVAVSVIEAGPGTELAGIGERELMIPASNLKLLTSGAALQTLGAEFRFETTLRLAGRQLIVGGDGDPGFGDPRLLALMTMATPAGDVSLDVESFLHLWVNDVLKAGIETIDEIVVDDGVFDRELVHPDWPRDQLNRRYCAQVSGFNFHLNQLYFYPRPRPGARPSLLNFEPHTQAVDVRNQATSRTGVHDDDSIWAARRLGSNELTFYGNVKHRYRTPVPVTIDDMPSLFGQILLERLRAAGVRVEHARTSLPGERLPEGTQVGQIVYTPITTALGRCNRDSQNLYAEALLKRMGYAMTGQPGSWLNGRAIVRQVAHARLDNPALSTLIKISDGSGLSRENRVAPATLTAWLNTFHNDEKLGGPFIDSLAVGGVSGTLRKRFQSLPGDYGVVQAKSGYINGVSCLSGYVTATDGRRRCFAIMINDLRAPVARAKRLQEQIVGAIAEDMVAVPAQLGSDD